MSSNDSLFAVPTYRLLADRRASAAKPAERTAPLLLVLTLLTLLMVFPRPAAATVPVWEDEAKNLTPQEIFEQRDLLFHEQSPKIERLSKSYWWFLVEISNEGQQPELRYIVFTVPSVKPTHAFEFRDGITSEQIFATSSKNLVSTNRTHLTTFEYLLGPGETRTVLIRKEAGLDTSSVDFEILDNEGYKTRLISSTAKLAIPVGLLAALLICNLFYFFSTRDSLFAFYSLYLASSMLLPVARFGGLQYMELPDSLEQSMTVVSGGLGPVFFALTLHGVLRDLQSAVIKWLCFGLVIPVSTLIVLIGLFDPGLGVMIFLSWGLGRLAAFALLLIVIIGLVRRHPLSPYLALGFLALFTGYFIGSLRSQGIIGVEFNGAAIAGIIVEGFIFTFLLALRFQIQLRERQTEVEQRAKLERTAQMALLGEMAASVNHELKQPLSAIKLLAENLKRQAQENPESALERLPVKLERIASLVDKAAGIADHMRRSSRLTSDESEHADVNKAIDGCRLIIDPQLIAGQIQLKINVENNLPLIAVHPLRFDQVILNLLTNAKDALLSVDPGTKTIQVTAQRLGKGEVEILVEDSAGGIPDDAIAHVFEKFFTTKEADEGTGIGLAICKDIIEDSDGSITVANTENGAQFRIVLPAVPSDPPRKD